MEAGEPVPRQTSMMGENTPKKWVTGVSLGLPVFLRSYPFVHSYIV